MLGGSYIALEMAQAFRRLGSEVIVLQKADQLAEREDEDAAEVLKAALEADGCLVHLGVDLRRVEAIGPSVRVQLASGEAMEGSHLFLATGRRPNTDNLGLEHLGVRLDSQGYVEVDDHLATNIPNLWAVGDIRGGAAFTHTAYNDFHVLKSQFLGNGTARRSRIIPYAVFTTPELGRVGLSEQQLATAGRRIKIGKRPMTDSGKAREFGKTEGFIKVIIDADDGAILGATVLCEQGSEVVQLFVELMNSGAPAATMRDAVHIHPTLGEAAKNAVIDAVTSNVAWEFPVDQQDLARTESHLPQFPSQTNSRSLRPLA